MENLISFTPIGPSSFTVNAGESFTINIAVDNLSATSTQGLTATLDGLAAAGLIVTGASQRSITSSSSARHPSGAVPAGRWSGFGGMRSSIHSTFRVDGITPRAMTRFRS